MKKIIIAILFLLFHSISSDSLEKYVLEHNNAYKNLELQIPFIKSKVKKYSGRIEYSYTFYSKESKKALKAYIKAQDRLVYKATFDILSKSCISGILTGFYDIFNNNLFINKKTFIFNLLSSFFIVIHRNRSLGKVPYFDSELNKNENLFNEFDFIMEVISGMCISQSIDVFCSFINPITSANAGNFQKFK